MISIPANRIEQKNTSRREYLFYVLNISCSSNKGATFVKLIVEFCNSVIMIQSNQRKNSVTIDIDYVADKTIMSKSRNEKRQQIEIKSTQFFSQGAN